MRSTTLAATAAISLSACVGVAQAETYNYVGPAYTTLANGSGPASCAVGTCVTYTLADRIIGGFTTPGALPPSTTTSVVPTRYSFSDGQNVFASTDPRVARFQLDVTTNAAGDISSAVVVLQQNQQTAALTTTPGAATSRFNALLINIGDRDAVGNNLECQTLITPETSQSLAGRCEEERTPPGAEESRALGPANALGVWTTQPVIPTLTEWAMIAMGLMLAGAGAIAVTRRGLRQSV